MRALGEPIVMVTAYDHPSALVAEAGRRRRRAGRRLRRQHVLGYRDTVPVTVEEMLMLAAAVRRGLQTPLLVGDLPFGSYEASDAQAIETAHRFVKEAGCDAVKLEGGGPSAERARAIVRAGVPVMGHVGLTPQTATALGGYRAQGRTASARAAVLEDACALQDAGCFSIVFEAIPARRHRRDHAAHGDAGDRHRRGRRAPTARCSCCTTCSASTTASCRSSPSASRTFARRWSAACPPTPRTSARARFPAEEHAYGIAPEEIERLRDELSREDHSHA